MEEITNVVEDIQEVKETVQEVQEAVSDVPSLIPQNDFPIMEKAEGLNGKVIVGTVAATLGVVGTVILGKALYKHHKRKEYRKEFEKYEAMADEDGYYEDDELYEEPPEEESEQEDKKKDKPKK